MYDTHCVRTLPTRLLADADDAFVPPYVLPECGDSTWEPAWVNVCMCEVECSHVCITSLYMHAATGPLADAVSAWVLLENDHSAWWAARVSEAVCGWEAKFGCICVVTTWHIPPWVLQEYGESALMGVSLCVGERPSLDVCLVTTWHIPPWVLQEYGEFALMGVSLCVGERPSLDVCLVTTWHIPPWVLQEYGESALMGVSLCVGERPSLGVCMCAILTRHAPYLKVCK